MKTIASGSFTVPISAVFASPKNAFDALKTFPGTKRPLLLTLATLPLLPLLMSVEFHAGLQHSLQEYLTPGRNTAAAITITGITGLLFLFTQAGPLLAHYLMFTLWIRIFGMDGGDMPAKAVWWYAVTPLLFRQVFYFILITLMATPRLKEISWAGYADPFVAWSGLLIYFGCRYTLGGDRKTSLAVAALSSVIGFLTPMTQLMGLR